MMRPVAMVSVFVAGIVGCSSDAPKRIHPDRTLPFLVQLNTVRLNATNQMTEPRESGPRQTPRTPVVLSNPEALTRQFARALANTGIFTAVVAEGDLPVSADLELEVSLVGEDFGEGQATWSGGGFSTAAWLFTGPVSWSIEDRAYPDSNVALEVRIRSPREGNGSPRAEEPLTFFTHCPPPVQDLELSFSERSEVEDWFWSILIPPCSLEGSPPIAAASLLARFPGLLAESEVPLMLASFPAGYFAAAKRFLGYDSRGGVVVIVSDRVLQQVVIAPLGPAGRRRPLDSDNLNDRARVGEAHVRRELARWIAARWVLGGDISNKIYYRIPLLEEERGLVRVEAVEEGGDDRRVSWTIFRPIEPSHSPDERKVGVAVDP